MKEDFGQ
jgi:hypothetical protein